MGKLVITASGRMMPILRLILFRANPLTPHPSDWLSALQHAQRQTWQTFADLRSESLFEGTILADVVELLPEESLLYVASSLPVRHLDQFAQPNSAHLRHVRQSWGQRD